METLDGLKKELISTKDLQSVVSTMKSIAAVNIKKFEKIAFNIVKYQSNVDLGLQAIVSQKPEIIKLIDYLELKIEKNTKKRDVVIIIGSNQGLCGRFNDKVVDYYLNNSATDINSYIISVGERVTTLLEAKKVHIEQSFSIPNSSDSIVNLVYDLFSIIEQNLNNLRKVLVYFTSHTADSMGNLTKKRIIPLEKSYFEKLKRKKWPTNNIPYWRIDSKKIVSDLVEQYIFSSIYLAISNSMASEQKNRLITLQGAEQNIKDHITELTLRYNQKRQSVITSELIDVVSGANALKKKKNEKNYSYIGSDC